MQWRDKYFDADFGDLAQHLSDLGVNVNLNGHITHGFWPNDPYAVPAARKLNAQGMHPMLSIHLCLKSIFPTPDAEPERAALNRWAERFGFAIDLLAPTKIILHTDPTSPNKYFHDEYMLGSFFPLVLDNVQDLSRYVPSDGCQPGAIKLLRVMNIGKAFESGYFPNLPPATSTIYEKNINFRVNFEYSPSVWIEPAQSEPHAPLISTAQIIGEKYPDPLSTGFRNFLWKLRFIYGNSRRINATNHSLVLWKRFFPQFSEHKILSTFRPSEGTYFPSPEFQIALHAILKELPIVCQELGYDFRLDSLLKGFVFSPTRKTRSVHPRYIEFRKKCSAASFKDELNKPWIWILEIHDGQIPVDAEGSGQIDYFGEREFPTSILTKYLDKLYEGNTEYAFLSSFEQGARFLENIQRIRKLLSDNHASERKFLDLFYLIFKLNEDLPILQPVGLIDGPLHPRHEVPLNLNTRGPVSPIFSWRQNMIRERLERGEALNDDD